MEKLERYKKLSTIDKSNLTTYSIYNSIYINARNNGKKISDEDVKRICDLSHHLYLKDEYYNYSSNAIADYITIGFIVYNIPIEKFEDADENDIYVGIDTNDYSWLLENEMER